MKTLKIIGVIVLTFFAGFITNSLLPFVNIPNATWFVVYNFLMKIVYIIYLSLFWFLFFRDKNASGTFLQKIKFKKIYLILVIIFVLLFSALLYPATQEFKRRVSISNSGRFLNNSIYENTLYKFRFTYPEGSVFAHANPRYGFVTRFFLPNGKTIKNDQENIGIYIYQKKNLSLNEVVQDLKSRFEKNGPMDIKEVQFGGQKGYKIIFVSDYTASKNTKEMIYTTVKNDTEFDLNYFPVVEESVEKIDKIANSFEFFK